MTHEQKINYIKYWLQKFGDRDNETFYSSVSFDDTSWSLMLQYDFDEYGTRLEPLSWCSSGFKHLHKNLIEDRSDEELNKIIEILNEKQKYY